MDEKIVKVTWEIDNSNIRELHNNLDSMDDSDLLELESAINNDCRILTEKLIKAYKDKVHSTILNRIIKEHEESFLNLLIIRSYISDNRNIKLPEREPSKYMLDVSNIREGAY